MRISDWSSDVCSSDLLADVIDGTERHAVLLQRDELFQILVLLDLLFDAGKQHELIRKLVGVERRHRVLELELRRQESQEVVATSRKQIGRALWRERVWRSV